MKLIPTGEALGFLSQAAPKPWVQRFLKWMAFNEGLKVYANEGKVQPYCMAGEFYVRHQATVEDYKSSEIEALVRKEYGDHIADQIVGKAIHERIDDEPNVWTDTDEPAEVDVGFFIFSDEVDWEGGRLKASAIDGHGDTFDILFWDQADHFGTRLPRPSYDAEMASLQFEFRVRTH